MSQRLLGKKRETRENDEYAAEEDSYEQENLNKKPQETLPIEPAVKNPQTVKKITLNLGKSIIAKKQDDQPKKEQEEQKNGNEDTKTLNQEKSINTPQVNETNKDKKEEESKNPQNEKNNQSSLFGSIFSKNPETPSLFSQSNSKPSLFASNNENSLFNNGTKSLFSSNINASQSLFNFTNAGGDNKGFFNSVQNKSDDEADSGDDKDAKQKSDSPEAFRPTKEEKQGPYSKKFVKLVENFFVYSKEQKKYQSKGEGFLSIEYAESPKKVALIVLRNKMGTKIFDGILNEKFEKIEKSTRNFKSFVVVTVIQKSEEKLNMIWIKIAFTRDEDVEEFEQTFNETIKLIK